MKNTGIPCCYYPTTVMLIDDDAKYLRVLEDCMEGPYKSFTRPYEAVKFLSQANFSSLEKLCAKDRGVSDHDTNMIQVDLTKVSDCLYNPKRFEEVSVVVVDYQMPGINGVEFCKNIRSSHFKIIMLTGEATLDLAVEAFNDSIIDKFIQKSAPDLDDALPKAIAEMQFKHFQDSSAYVINSFMNSDDALPHFLQNEDFVIFFKSVLRKNQVVEYYILNYYGDFIMLTEGGKVLYFTVRDDETFEQSIRLDAESAYFEEPSPEAEVLYEAIKKKEKMPFLWGLKEHSDFMSWPVFAVETEACDGRAFYYALIKEDALDRGLNFSKIFFHKSQK